MENKLSIGIQDDVILIRATGQMRATNCYALRRFLFPYLENVKNPIAILFDLENCIYMDSTFIGFIITIERKFSRIAPVHVEIVNPSEKITNTLKVFSCLDKVEIIYDKEVPPITTFILDKKYDAGVDQVEMIFEAHKELSSLSEQNRKEFEHLLEELKKILPKKEA